MGKIKDPLEVYLILSNNTSLRLIKKYREIFISTKGLGDTLVIYHLSKNNCTEDLKNLNTFIFSDEVLTYQNCKKKFINIYRNE